MEIATFQNLLTERGQELFRAMPWRSDTRPYYILVSELMLQQTQVDRVIPKFNNFIVQFPTLETLAEAPLADVLKLWNGLGYNRRAKYLHDSAKYIIRECDGYFPDSYESVLKLAGVGPGTAGAIMAYAFNQPVVYVETNIRTVYLHHFFPSRTAVSDLQLLELVEKTVSRDNPRVYYWALMDYGSWLKKQGRAHLTQSKHYVRQSPLVGSVRQLRGELLKQLTKGEVLKIDFDRQFGHDKRYEAAVSGLIRDGLISITADKLHLTK